jgi:hypothetical protein
VTGIGPHLSEDAFRGASALALAFLRDDYEGQDAITAHATPGELLGIASAAVALAAGALTFTARALGEPDPVAFAETALAAELRTAIGLAGGAGTA